MNINFDPDCIGRQWFNGPSVPGRPVRRVRRDYQSGKGGWQWDYGDSFGWCESQEDARNAVEASHALALEAADEQAEQEARDAGPDALRTYMNEREREEM